MSRKLDAEDIAPRPFIWRDPYLWQKKALAAQMSADMPQSVLLTGAKGIGKTAFALNVARALLCDKRGNDGLSCGVCLSCLRVAADKHPDFILIDQHRYDEKKNEWVFKDDLPVDAIRDMMVSTRVASHYGRGRVVVITPAEKMNLASANALLKTLEEPLPDNYFILVAHQWRQLPATILSRCQKWTAPFPSEPDALAFLASEGVENAPKRLNRAGGAPLLATENTAWAEDEEAWLKELLAPQRLSPFAAGLSWAGKREELRDRFAAWLSLLIAFVSDLARVNAATPPRFFPECHERLQIIAPALETPALFRYYHALLRQRRLLGRALTPRLLVEALLMDYRALFFKTS